MGKLIDLTGQVFNRWTVLKRDLTKKGDKTYWICQCSCNNKTIKSIYSNHLKSGGSKSCGCLKKEITSQRFLINEIGHKYGRLTVINRDINNKAEHVYWICECSCGTIKSIEGKALREGKIVSCGCKAKEYLKSRKKEDATDKTFGFLKVIKRVIVPSSKAINYLCFCLSCGNSKIVSAYNLWSGVVKSCGCLRSSYGETKIAKLLNILNYSFKREYSFNDCINPKTRMKLRFDFIIFDDNEDILALIEFQGKQHYEETTMNRIDTLANRQYRDNIKREYCFIKDIPLIEISYLEEKNLNESYIKKLLSF